MKVGSAWMTLVAGVALAQTPSGPLASGFAGVSVPEDPRGTHALPNPVLPGWAGLAAKSESPAPNALAEHERISAEIREAKLKERGPRRFASDLFDIRQLGTVGATEGGVSAEYVLGTGDQVAIHVFGSATFEVPGQVDGRGDLVVPKVGVVKVAGLPLGKAKTAVHSLISRQFSNVDVDLVVVKLREVRIQVLGEVYRPGSYLVPSLSSLVNVLSLAGGPTAIGTFRDIRVIRAGKVVHRLDLYPLRTEGLGNQNFYLQNGDHLFVPLAQNQVVMEGAFVRVQPMMLPGLVDQAKEEEKPEGHESRLPFRSKESDKDKVKEPAALGARLRDTTGDRKLAASEMPDPSSYTMLFEMLPGETASAALRFAGGLHPWAEGTKLSLRRVGPGGLMSVQSIEPSQASQMEMKRGDTLSAFAAKDTPAAMVSVTGHARVPGLFARTEGLRVGALLRSSQQILPDVYKSRGELLRTLPTGESLLLTFDVQRALEGDPSHDLLLADRDRVELFRNERMRRPETVTVHGAMVKTGKFPFVSNMRASDLLFWAQIPEKSANRLQAELARTREGQVSEIISLDLSKLLSDESSSPVGLKDEQVNPLLRPDDQITVFEKPEFRLHRTVKISGQVGRPGTYILDTQRPTLSALIRRAGGITAEAMPQAGLFFRRPGGTQPDDSRGEKPSSKVVTDPTIRGVGDILERLTEAKFYPVDPTGTRPGGGATLFKPQVMHGLSSLNLNRVVVDFAAALSGKDEADPELLDGDEIIIPRRTDSAIVIGEVASPFAYYKVLPGMNVSDLLARAGSLTRNADRGQIRLLRANGQIVDSWVTFKKVEPGDVVLVPQRVRRDSSWQENLQALTPLALIANALRR